MVNFFADLVCMITSELKRGVLGLLDVLNKVIGEIRGHHTIHYTNE